MSNGQWTDCDDRTEEFISNATTWNKTDRENIVASLESGQKVRFRSDWHSLIRKALAPRPDRPFPESSERNGLGNTIDSDDY